MTSQVESDYIAYTLEKNDRLQIVAMDLYTKLKRAEEALVYYSDKANWNGATFEPINMGGWPLPNDEPWKIAQEALEVVRKHNDD